MAYLFEPSKQVAFIKRVSITHRCTIERVIQNA